MSEQPKHAPVTEIYPSPTPLYSPYYTTGPASPASPPLPSYASFQQVDTQDKRATDLNYPGHGFSPINPETAPPTTSRAEHFELYGENRVELESPVLTPLRK
ncbi:hypothetical protein LTR50_006895 [Elasticomyces elasticus]|nr:hypothetical protein LTR50_006895 [Elasticomyces elasticus]